MSVTPGANPAQPTPATPSADEQRFRALIEQSSAGIAETDLAGRILFVNRRFCQITGYPEAELLRLSVHDLTHPDDLPQTRAFVAHGAATGSDYALEKRYVRKDGSPVWVNVAAGVVKDHAGRPRSIIGVVTDVSARKAAEHALAQSQRRWELAVTAASDGIWDYDLVTEDLYWSPRCKEMLGYADDELPATLATFRALIHPDDHPAMHENFTRHAAGELPAFSAEYRLRHRDGSYRWVLSRGLVLRDPADGTPRRLVGSHTDVTDRRRTEDALRRSESRLQLAVDALGLGLWDVDLTNYTVEESDRFVQMLGLPPHTRHVNAGEWGAFLHPDDRERARQKFAGALAGTCDYDDEQRITGADGVTRWVHARGAVVRDPASGRPLRMVGVCTDITARKTADALLRASEERFRATFEQAAVGIAHVGLDGRWLRVNQKLCDIVGHTLDELMPRTFQDITHPDDLPANLDLRRRAVAGEIDSYSLEKRYVRRDGSVVWATLTSSVARTPDGRPDYFISVVEDVTERKRVEQALLSSERRFRKLVEQSPLSTQFFAPDGTMRTANHAWQRLFGVRVEDLAGRYNILHDPQLVERGIAPLVRRAFHDAQAVPLPAIPYVPWLGEYAGQERWTTALIFPVRDVDGRTEEVVLVHHDMTEQKRAEDALRASEARFRAAFDQTAIGIVLSDVDGRFQRVNAAFCRLVGRAPDELLGRDSRWITHPDDVADNAVHTAAVRDPATPSAAYQKRFVHKDGHPVWTRVHLTAVRGDGPAAGRPAESIVAVIEDVTHQKRAEESLARLAEQRRLALDSARLGWWHLDPASGDVLWDDRFKAIFGVAADRLRYDKVLALIHPDDRARVDAAVRAATDPADPKPYHVEYRVLHPDRSARWVLAKGQAYFEGVGPARRYTSFVGTVADVTDDKAAERALRESESRFRQLADAMPQIVWSARPDGFLDYYNRQWYDYTALPPGTVGNDWSAILHPDDLPAVHRAWADATRTGQPYELEFRLRRHDGAFRWFLGRARPVRDDAGRVVRWFGTDTDIHDRKELQQRIESLLDSERHARAEAERAGRMKDEFLATLSHELRTPLNAIVGWSQLLAVADRAADPALVREGVDVIHRNARAQAQIIEDLLDMSRITAGKVRLDVQPVDPAPLIRAALDTVRPAADARRVRLDAHLAPLPAAPLHADPARFQQVLWNLLTNAVKFTPPGGTVTLRAQAKGQAQDPSPSPPAPRPSPLAPSFTIEISDTGTGIPPDFLPHVFDRFRQADSTTTRKHGGLGLGLSIVKTLVEMHGGTVRADSPGPDQGSTFTVTLPLSPSSPTSSSLPPAPGTQPAPGPRPLPADAPSLDGLRVLVVDDEPDARDLVRRLLEDRDATVRTAPSAAAAFDLLPAFRPDVLVSDIGMPGEDGYSLLARIRTLPPDQGGHTPAVALTAYARAEDRLRALSAGFQLHAVKPVDPAELVTIVASLARHRPRP